MPTGRDVSALFASLALIAVGCLDVAEADDISGGGGFGGGTGGLGAGGAPPGGGGAGAPGDSGPCWPGEKWCGICAGPTDPNHGCGGPGCAPCGLPHATAGCTAGSCSVLACSAGWADCNGSAADGCESHTLADHDHCGTCGKSCSAMAVCLSGKCEANCGTLTDCSGSCVNTASDPKNCGACGNACEASETCSSGSCKCASSSLTKCGGACVNLMTDKQNCGVCGKQCTGVTAQCLSGVCSPCNCQTGLTCCGTSCANLASDANNCGTCSNACGAGKLCQGGSCVAACGGEGQACCSSNACNAGYRCTATLDQSSTLAADWQPGCVRCGGSGEVACLSGSTPACSSSALTVYWDTHLKLHLCLDPSGSGGPGEKCSVGVPGTCYDGGYACVTLAATPGNDWCLRCGVFDHVCCAGQQCQTGLSCKFKNNYLCKP